MRQFPRMYEEETQGHPMYISDQVWSAITDYFDQAHARHRGRGRPRVSRRAVLSGIVSVLLEDMPWGDLPTRQFKVSGNTCWRQFREWVQTGTWSEIVDVLKAAWSQYGRIQWATLLTQAATKRIERMEARRPRQEK